MSKHMKPEAISNDEFYKARIKRLEDENLKLRAEITELRKEVGIAELAMEHDKNIHDGIVAEYHECLAQKDGEIAAMELRIKRLEAAIVKSALREV